MSFKEKAKNFAAAGLNKLPANANLFLRYMTGLGNKNLDFSDEYLTNVREETKSADLDSARFDREMRDDLGRLTVDSPRINADGDDASEFACLDRNYNRINIYDVTNDALVLKEAITPTFNLQNIAVIPTTSSNQSILGIYQAEEYDSSYGYYDNVAYRVTEIDNKGHVIWRSPSIGINHVDGMRTRKNNAGEVELQIGNPNMALLVK